MKQCFTFLIWISLGFSCAPKEIYYLSKGSGKFNHGKLAQSPTTVKHVDSALTKILEKPMSPISDSISFFASAQPFFSNISLPKPTNLLNKQLTARANYRFAGKVLPEQLLLKKFLPKQVVRKSIKSISLDKDKPVHKLATIGLLLSLSSILFLALAVLFTGVAGVLSTVMLLSAIGGIVTGLIALKDIKSIPGQYSGKGRALAGVIIGIVVTALFLLLVVTAVALFFFIMLFSENWI